MVSEELFADAVWRLKGNLQKGSILARRRILKSFGQKIEVGRTVNHSATPLFQEGPSFGRTATLATTPWLE